MGEGILARALRELRAVYELVAWTEKRSESLFGWSSIASILKDS